MKNTAQKRILQLAQINERARTAPGELVAEENRRYREDLEALAAFLAESDDGRRLTMLSGPSSSGKTTTALLLRDSLRARGLDAHVVSLDNFYRGRCCAPQLENGEYDYEALEALNLEQLHQCMKELLQDGCTHLPRFDFVTGRPAPELTPLQLERDSVVIFEGIHALNPVFEQHLPREHMYKVFVNTLTPIYSGDEKWVRRRDLRLVRRLLRDERFRSSSFENTLNMWRQVVRGENLYLFPYVDTVDWIIDTTHAYEPCLFAGALLPQLHTVADDHPDSELVHHLERVLDAFMRLPDALVPADSLLREFLGGGIYAG